MIPTPLVLDLSEEEKEKIENAAFIAGKTVEELTRFAILRHCRDVVRYGSEMALGAS
jgi:uncharacterized protein (DUF1778 family)